MATIIPAHTGTTSWAHPTGVEGHFRPNGKLELVAFQNDHARPNGSTWKTTGTKHEYVLTIAAAEDAKWSLKATPSFVAESVSVNVDREIAKVGRKSLTVAGQRTMTHFVNKWSMVLPVKVGEPEAEKMEANAPADVLLVMRFVGLGYHKSCRMDCSKLFGVSECVGVNDGFGEFYRAELVGYRVEVNGMVVAEKRPEAEK